MTQGRPTAAPAYFPYKHDSMAVVMREEERLARVAKQWERFRYERERRSARG